MHDLNAGCSLQPFDPGNPGNSLLNMPCQASHTPTEWLGPLGVLPRTYSCNSWKKLIPRDPWLTWTVVSPSNSRGYVWVYMDKLQLPVSEAVDFAEVWFGPPAEGASGKWYDMMLQWCVGYPVSIHRSACQGRKYVHSTGIFTLL